MIVFTRFRNLPDAQMKHIDAYLQTGKPIIGIRPAVVAFRNKLDSKYAKYSSNYGGDDFHSGYGRQVLGATWISHHGHHGRESTCGIPVNSTDMGICQRLCSYQRGKSNGQDEKATSQSKTAYNVSIKLVEWKFSRLSLSIQYFSQLVE